MPQSLTQDHLRSAVREIIEHFNVSQSQQDARMDIRFVAIDKRFDGVDRRLDKVEYRLDNVEQQLTGVTQDVSKIKLAVIELMPTDRHLHNLVSCLRREGIPLDDREIFSA